jgi:SAM-dependent methyltransferase
MNAGRSFDPIWEQKYAAGHGQRYPWDIVVSFVFRHAPRDRPRRDVHVLEVGCGTGSNVWFAAREGFSVTGIDASESAIKAARIRMADEGVAADLRVANFASLPFDDARFHLVVDRGALTCCGREVMICAIGEIARVTMKGGHFLFNPYADHHSSFASGRQKPDGATDDIAEGTLTGVGQVYFASRRELPQLLGPNWEIVSLVRREDTDMTRPTFSTHAEWRVIARRL